MNKNTSKHQKENERTRTRGKNTRQKTWITNKYIYVGADVHAFGVNNLKWTDDSRKIGYCPKEQKKRRTKNQIAVVLKPFSIETTTKKMRIKVSAIEMPFTKALSEPFASVWISRNLAKYAYYLSMKMEKSLNERNWLCTNKQTQMQHRDRWRMVNT